MKSIAKWYKWILLAIIFQFCVLLYINNVFLNADIKVSVTDAGVKSKPATGDFEVPEDAQNIIPQGVKNRFSVSPSISENQEHC